MNKRIFPTTFSLNTPDHKHPFNKSTNRNQTLTFEQTQKTLSTSLEIQSGRPTTLLIQVSSTSTTLPSTLQRDIQEPVLFVFVWARSQCRTRVTVPSRAHCSLDLAERSFDEIDWIDQPRADGTASLFPNFAEGEWTSFEAWIARDGSFSFGRWDAGKSIFSLVPDK